MPDITIQINTPTLVAGESFKVRYREIGGAWSGYSTRTNAAFTLSGLTPGNYEMEVIVVKGGIECPAIIRPFTVIAPFSCITFEAEIVQNDVAAKLVIDYTIPGGFVNPPCGWKIILQGALNNKTINYSVLPTPPINIPVLNEAMVVKVVADLCGKSQTCFEADVPAADNPCTPMVVNSVTAVWAGIANNQLRYNVTFNITQSIPPTTTAFVTVTQTNTIIAGGGLPGQTSFGSFNPKIISTTATSFTVQIDFNPNIVGDIYSFAWFVTDRCGTQHTGSGTVAKV